MSLPRSSLRPLAACTLLALAGCASESISLDRHLGESLRQAQDQQAVYPPGTWPASRPQSTDGVASVHAIERYQQSYAKPQPPVNVMNIGVGTPQTGGMAPR